MKKTLLLTGVLLALTASIASSAGLNLAWNNCLPGSGSALDKSSACDASTVFDTQVLVGSVITGFAVANPNFVGANSVVDFQSSNLAGGNEFWHMASGECREGSFNVFFSFGSAITGCAKTLYGPSSNYFAVTDWKSSQDGRPNRYRLRAGAARNPGGSIVAATQYVTFEMDMDMNHTDITDTGTPYCVGCSEPACIVYNSCEIDQPAPTPAVIVSGSATRNYATWQGGVLQPDANNLVCPAAVPTQQGSWGKLKSLYR